MPINTRMHAILTETERDAIVSALDFFTRYNSGLIQRDDFENARLAFREHGHSQIDDLALKIATLK